MRAVLKWCQWELKFIGKFSGKCAVLLIEHNDLLWEMKEEKYFLNDIIFTYKIWYIKNGHTWQVLEQLISSLTPEIHLKRS